MTNHTRIRWLSLGLLLTAAAAYLYAHEGHAPLPTRGVQVDPKSGTLAVSAESRQALGVTTAEARLASLEERLAAPAVVVAPWQGQAFVTPRLVGRLTAIHVPPGQTVTKGQLLAELHSLELEDLQLEYKTALNDARLAAENLKQLEAAGASSDLTLREHRARNQETRNSVDIARRKLLALGVDEGRLDALARDPKAPPVATLPITSPLAGVVFHHDAQVGQIFEPSDHLFMVVDLSTVWVRIDVLERDLPRIAEGQPVALQFPAVAGSGRVEPKVQVKGLALDPKTRQGTVWVELPNPQTQYLPGMYGQAEFRFPAEKPTLVVPEAAVVRLGAERFVFVQMKVPLSQPDPKEALEFERTNVVVGRRQGGLVELVKGQVGPGERVMTAGSHELATYFGHGAFRLSPEAAENIGMKLDRPQRRPIAPVTTLAGRVEVPADRRAVVSARLGGTLDRILVDRNEEVKAGQTVAEVVSLEFQTMQLELLRNHLQLELLEKTVEQLRPLAEQAGSGVTRRQLREAESAATAARQRRDSFLSKLEAVGVAPGQLQQVLKGQFVRALPVVAPISGKVVRFLGTLGQAVKTADPLFEVHDLSRPMVRGIVAERQLAGVAPGQPARVRVPAAPGWVGEAAVARSGQVFDPADRTLSVWAELRGRPAPIPLLHGMFADLTVVVGPPVEVLTLPREAVLREGSREFVFVEKDGTFERRPVQTGRSDDQRVEVVSGVTEKDRVAVSGVAGLQTAFAAIK